jgi:Zn-dependent protease
MDTRRGYWLVGKWNQIPLFLHWTILLWVPWYLFQGKSLAWLVVSFPAFVGLLAAHEIGHAIAARRRRVKVESINLYVLHGLCEHEDPYYERDHVLIAWGGVFAQGIVLVLALALDHLSSLFLPSLRYSLDPLFFVLINVNCVIAAINLIPIQPLDGHIAWRAIPLLRVRYLPQVGLRLRSLGGMLNLRKRRARVKDAERLADEFIERMKNK